MIDAATTLDELRTEIERLLRAIDPKDLGGPLYVVFTSDLPVEFTGGYKGFTLIDLDLVLRPFIAGWRGRGPAMVLDDRRGFEEIDDSLPWIDEARRRRYAYHSLAITSLHEAAHWFEHAVLFTDPSPFSIETSREAVRMFAAEGRRADEERTAIRPRYDDHGPEFIRTALHLHARAAAAGFEFPVSAVLPPGYDADRYRLALRAELEQHKHTPLSILRTLPVPSSVVGLFERDLAKLHHLAERSAAVTFSLKGRCMSSLLQDVRKLLAGRKEEDQRSWQDLVRSLANGEKPDAERIAEFLDRAGKTVEDLDLAVQQYRDRKRLRGLVEAIPALRRQVERINKQILAEEGKLASAQEAYDTAVDPLLIDREAAEQAIAEGNAAKRTLIETAEEPTIRCRLREIEQELHRLDAEDRQRRQRIDRAEETALEEAKRATKTTSEGQQQEYRSRAVRDKGLANTIRQEIADAQVERDQLIAEREKLTERLSQV